MSHVAEAFYDILHDHFHRRVLQGRSLETTVKQHGQQTCMGTQRRGTPFHLPCMLRIERSSLGLGGQEHYAEVPRKSRFLFLIICSRSARRRQQIIHVPAGRTPQKQRLKFRCIRTNVYSYVYIHTHTRGWSTVCFPCSDCRHVIELHQLWMTVVIRRLGPSGLCSVWEA